MNDKDDVLRLLDDAIEAIESMKEILDETEPDGPLAFLEASQHAQDQIARALHAALFPLLNTPSGVPSSAA